MYNIPRYHGDRPKNSADGQIEQKKELNLNMLHMKVFLF